jgi:TRAP-type mannitol/chloroaromatic compound transport system permease small subunit
MGKLQLYRFFAWATVGMTFALLVNNYLDFWRGWPGVWHLAAVLGLSEGDASGAGLALIQLAIYLALVVVLPAWYVRRRPYSLRQDSARLHRFNIYLVRWSFWAIFLVGLADALISFLRIEAFLEPLVGHDLTAELGLSRARVPYVHLPLILLAFVVAGFTRTLGFQWLGLLVVVSELLIVIGRFIFSYEQAFMADLVRFWYAALFLIASAYTLYEDGHVRVDVLYARFRRRKKGKVNAIGSIILGMVFCWTILLLGLSSQSAIINAPLIQLEVTQSGFGMYIKYLMAGFLGFFAVTMMIQFSSYFLESVADARDEPGSRLREPEEVEAEAHAQYEPDATGRA